MKETVLKTVRVQALVGSNPTPSASLGRRSASAELAERRLTSEALAPERRRSQPSRCSSVTRRSFGRVTEAPPSRHGPTPPVPPPPGSAPRSTARASPAPGPTAPPLPPPAATPRPPRRPRRRRSRAGPCTPKSSCRASISVMMVPVKGKSETAPAFGVVHGAAAGDGERDEVAAHQLLQSHRDDEVDLARDAWCRRQPPMVPPVGWPISRPAILRS